MAQDGVEGSAAGGSVAKGGRLRGVTLAALIGIFAGAALIALLSRLLPGRVGALVATLRRRREG